MTNFYVSSVFGIDGGDCSNSATPCATVNYAIEQGYRTPIPAPGGPHFIYMDGHGLWSETVNLWGNPPGWGNNGLLPAPQKDNMAGWVFDGSWCGQGAPGGKAIWNGGTTQNGIVIVNTNASAAVRNFNMAANGTLEQSAIYVQQGGQAHIFDGMVFNVARIHHLHAEGAGSQIQVWDNYTIVGDAGGHAACTCGAQIGWDGGTTVTLAGTRSFSSSFLEADTNAVIAVGDPTTFSGAAIGLQAVVLRGGCIWTAGQSTSIIPGSGVTNDGTGSFGP